MGENSQVGQPPPGAGVPDAAPVLDDLPILLVDDEPDVLKALSRTLGRKGWTLVPATGPQAGLAELAKREFGVIISDFRMPGMDGVTFLARARDAWPDAERILLTAHADFDALERGINDASIGRFLRKPWDRDVLLDIVHRALTASRLRREHAVLLQRLANRHEELSYVNALLQQRVDANDRDIDGIRRRWDVALNAISDPILIISEALHIEGGNSAAATFSGHAAATLEGRKCHDMMFGRTMPCDGCPVASGSGQVLCTKDGQEIVLKARAYPLPGPRPSYLCIYQDISREITFQRNAAQMDKMAAIGRMASSVAHEINNPLHGILSFVHLAEKPGVTPEKLARYHEVIRDCALRCRDIVQGLRNYARQAKPEERANVDLHAVCGKAMLMFESAVAARGNTVVYACDAPEAMCLGNANQLQQVVINLIQNALDVVQEGRVDVRVSVETDQVVLTVDDSGPGVPADLRDKIFEPFFTTKAEGVGTGLGLSICHSIIRGHQGSIDVSTSPQGGARFSVRLPRVSQEGSEHP